MIWSHFCILVAVSLHHLFATEVGFYIGCVYRDFCSVLLRFFIFKTESVVAWCLTCILKKMWLAVLLYTVIDWFITVRAPVCWEKKSTFNITAVEIAWILFNLLFFVVVLHQRVYFLINSFDSLVDLSFFLSLENESGVLVRWFFLGCEDCGNALTLGCSIYTRDAIQFGLAVGFGG